MKKYEFNSQYNEFRFRIIRTKDRNEYKIPIAGLHKKNQNEISRLLIFQILIREKVCRWNYPASPIP